ncbi:hypothetical protein ABC304_07795 [Microbacterium sp. 1P10UB]|uniref:hypothetical protein n=1 Tax=unclassified Microbacterium TaxID=2609290 RepID=UPI00399FE0D5
MPERRGRNISGWVLFAIGIGLTGVGSFQLWRLWDAEPGSPGTDGLLFPLVFGVFFLITGIYSLVKRKPLTDDGSVRYPYLLNNRKHATARTHLSKASNSDDQEAGVFARRPNNPAAALAFGVVLLLAAALSVPLLIADPLAVGRGVPLYLVSIALFVTGVWFTALGVVWRRRDKARL